LPNEKKPAAKPVSLAPEPSSYNWTVLLASALTAGSMLYLALRIPMGIPGEWGNPYHTSFPDAGQVLSFGLVMLLFLAAAFLFDWFSRRVKVAARAVLVAILTAGYGGVLFSSAICGPMGRAELAVPAFEWNACGLFQREATRISDPGEYLKRFPETLAKYGADYKATVRVNNNPPGTTMLFYGALRLSERAPWLPDFAAGLLFGSGFKPPTETYAATVLGAWFLLVGAALAFVPAYLVASYFRAAPSFFPAAVAMLALSLLLFTPDNDTLQVTFFLWMLYFCLRSRDGHAVLWGAGLGLVASVAFFFTLATAVVVLILVSCTAVEIFLARTGLRQRLLFWAASALGLLVGFFALYAATGYNSFSSLLACYQNHEAFYLYYPRTYWKWLLYNPVEFLLFTGGPLFAVVLASLWCRPPSPAAAAPSRAHAAWCLLAAALAVLILLDISGKNSSEINRLWVFFMPLLTLPACVLLTTFPGGLRRLVTVGLLQVMMVLATRTFVDVWRIEEFFRDISKYLQQ
jgi:hypothetical protein